MHTFVLAIQAFPERHTGEEIAKELKHIVNSYSAREKVSAVVHDQAANMLCHRILSQDEGWESIFCSAHCLQLCLKEGLSITAIDRLLRAARKLVGRTFITVWWPQKHSRNSKSKWVTPRRSLCRMWLHDGILLYIFLSIYLRPDGRLQQCSWMKL